jgi:hypothetical protein
METATLVEQLMGFRIIQGDVVGIIDPYYFLRDQDGKNVRVHTNKKTKITGDINPEARIEAQVKRNNLNNLAVKMSLVAFMSNEPGHAPCLESHDDRHLHWITEILGYEKEWDAEITDGRHRQQQEELEAVSLRVARDLEQFKVFIELRAQET